MFQNGVKTGMVITVNLHKQILKVLQVGLCASIVEAVIATILNSVVLYAVDLILIAHVKAV